jgi:hypothetical protein
MTRRKECMVGEKYWSIGIVLKWNENHGWSATVDFMDDGFCDSQSTEGNLHTRYFGPVEQAIDVVLADAQRLGIEFKSNIAGKPFLLYTGDGENKDWPAPPNWKSILREQARRIGFTSYLEDLE